MYEVLTILGSEGGPVFRALASHQYGPGSSPGVDAICELSLLLVLSFVLISFSPGTSVFPTPQKPTLPNSNSIWNARTRFNEILSASLLNNLLKQSCSNKTMHYL